ncbi:MAG TPA: RNA methyltransferase [Candidatus Hydrogenedentes bacterium]|nr:RNA methyltransferase [Candidatus Hydrogenedentota bacterium]
MQSLCPYTEPFDIEGESFSADDVIAILEPLISPRRRARIDRTVANRTYAVTPVMEGLYDRGNVSAVLRTAEGLGYQSVHIIETSARFKQARQVSQGAEKWLDITRWETTKACIDHLKSLGYRILATTLDSARPIGEYAFDEPTALVFGNERDGVTPELLERADGRIVVPMLGFSQSFNISVAAAISLYHIHQDRCARLGRHGDLSPTETRILTAQYYRRSVASADKILLETRRA